MTEEIKKPRKPTTVKAVALKTLCTSKGMVKKGETFTCTIAECERFKSLGAV